MSDDLDRFERDLAESLRRRIGGTHVRRDARAVAEAAMASSGDIPAANLVPIALVGVLLVAAALAVRFLPAGTPGRDTVGPAVSASAPPASQIVTPSPVPSSTAPVGEKFDRFRMAIPEGWRVTRHTVIFMGGGGWGAQVANVDVKDPCVKTGDEVRCDITPYHLTANTAVIWIGTDTAFLPIDPVLDPPPDAEPVMVDGLPGIVEVVEPRADTAAEKALRWTIAMPDRHDGWYLLTAEIRGPDLLRIESQVRAMIEGIRWDPPLMPLSSDPDARAAAARAAIDHLIEADRSDAYACFPSEPGVEREALIGALPNFPTRSEPLPVTCSFDVVPTPRQLWEVRLRFHWEADGSRAAGTWQVTAYVNASGAYVGGQAGGDFPDR